MPLPMMGPGSMPSSMMGPGSVPSGPMSSSHASISSHSSVAHVPLLAPGVPKYCVRDRILGCPSTCERVDEWGCRSCPCAPGKISSFSFLTNLTLKAPRKNASGNVVC